MKKLGSLWLAVACASAGGCASTKELSTESRNATSAIEKAEKAGAKQHATVDLEVAKGELAAARHAEDAAVRDRKAAHGQLVAAQKRDDRARIRIASRKAALTEHEEERRAQLLLLDTTKEHAEELRTNGVTDEEVSELIDTRQHLIEIRIKSLEAELESIKKELIAMESVRKDAALEIQTARARLKTATVRLQAARASYARAEERANVAHAGALDARRTALAEEIGELAP